MCTHNRCFEQKLQKRQKNYVEITDDLFTAVKNCSILHGRVFVMNSTNERCWFWWSSFSRTTKEFYLRITHYASMPIRYTAIFHSLKNLHFQMRNFDIFLNCAQHIDCGYTLEPPH